MNGRPAILFVCLGNICRSPLAEAAFANAAEKAGLDVESDSAGTGNWHIGDAPDPRARATALANGVDISRQRARQVTRGDFTRFTQIFAMDHENLDNLQAIAPDDTSAEVSLLLDLVPGRSGEAVADPYFGGAEGFAQTWADVSAAAEALVAKLARG